MIKNKNKYLIPLMISIFISLTNINVVASKNEIDPRDKNNIVIIDSQVDTGIVRFFNNIINKVKTIGDILTGTYYEDFDFKKYIINGQSITKEEIVNNPDLLKELLKSRENEGLEGIEVLAGEEEIHSLVEYVELLTRDIRDRTISSDTVWTKEKGPYYITGEVIIEKGKTLTIEEGTEIYFKKTPITEKRSLIIVEGNLITKGTDNNRISFRAYGDNASKGSWSGIYVSKKGSIDLNYTNIDKAGFLYGAAIYSEGEMIISNCNITNSLGNGITTLGDIDIVNSNIKNNEKVGIDIYAKDKSLDI